MVFISFLIHFFLLFSGFIYIYICHIPLSSGRMDYIKNDICSDAPKGGTKAAEFVANFCLRGNLNCLSKFAQQYFNHLSPVASIVLYCMFGEKVKSHSGA